MSVLIAKKIELNLMVYAFVIPWVFLKTMNLRVDNVIFLVRNARVLIRQIVQNVKLIGYHNMMEAVNAKI
jgi:hypothetical protein